jgi:hypothetical protein
MKLDQVVLLNQSDGGPIAPEKRPSVTRAVVVLSAGSAAMIVEAKYICNRFPLHPLSGMIVMLDASRPAFLLRDSKTWYSL